MHYWKLIHMFFNLAILREAILIQCSYSFRSWRLSMAQTVSVERMQGVAKYLLDVAYSRNTCLLSLQCNLWWNTNWKTIVLDWQVWNLLVYWNLCLCKAVVWDYALLMVLKYSCVLCCLSLKQDVETLALYSHLSWISFRQGTKKFSDVGSLLESLKFYEVWLRHP